MDVQKVSKEIGEKLIALDDRARKLFEPLGDTAAVHGLGWASKLGDQPELRTISGALLLAGVFSANDRLVRAGARMMLAHEAATFVKDQLKREIDRERPRSTNGRRAAKPVKGNDQSKEMQSFPSGHSAGGFAAARAFAREFPEYGWAAMAAAAVVAGIQIVRCAHYPTDVAAGVAIGLSSEKTIDLLWDAARMDERSES